MKQTSLSQSFFILSRTNLIIKLISILYVPLLLAILGPAGHGDYALAYVYYGSLVALLSDSVTKVLIRRISWLTHQGRTDQAIGFTRRARQLSFYLALVVAAAVMALSSRLAGWLHAPQLRLSLMVLAVSLIIVSLSAVYRAFFQATRRMDLAGQALVIEHVINAGFTIGLSWALLPYGMALALAGAAGGTLLGSLVSLVFLHRHFGKISRGVEQTERWQTVFELIRPLLAISLLLQLTHMAEALIIKLRFAGLGLSERLASTAYSDISSYKMAQSIPMVLLSALGTALYPAITESVIQADRARFYHRIKQALRHTYLIVWPAAAGMMLVAHELNVFVFDGRVQREQLMMAAAGMIIPLSLALVQQAVLQSDGRMSVAQLPLVVSLITQTGLSWLLIRPPLGIMGVVAAGYGGLLVLCLSNQVLLQRRRVKINYRADLAKPVLASLVMSLGLIGLKYVLPDPAGRLSGLGLMLLLIMSGGLIYGISLIRLGGLRRSDLELLPPKLAARLPEFITRRMLD